MPSRQNITWLHRSICLLLLLAIGSLWLLSRVRSHCSVEPLFAIHRVDHSTWLYLSHCDRSSSRTTTMYRYYLGERIDGQVFNQLQATPTFLIIIRAPPSEHPNDFELRYRGQVISLVNIQPKQDRHHLQLSSVR